MPRRRCSTKRARRLARKTDGIAATIVDCAVTLEADKSTGETPGAALRGPRL